MTAFPNLVLAFRTCSIFADMAAKNASHVPKQSIQNILFGERIMKIDEAGILSCAEPNIFWFQLWQ